MICCSDCFRDPEIRSIIDNLGQRGNCPICGSHNVNIYDTDVDTILLGMFDGVLSVYTAHDDLPKNYPDSDMKMLCASLKEDWDIFSDIEDSAIIGILMELSPEIAAVSPKLFSQPVGVSERYDLDYLKEHSILRAQKWADFVTAIKHNNRFHTNLINTKLLENYCMRISTTIDENKQRFFRARIARDSSGYKPSEMGAPPQAIATDGRANSAGISRLYLSDGRETTLHEIRAAEYDYVSIGTFKAKKQIHIVDLRRLERISPFEEDIDCTALTINREHLQRINEEMSKTMRRGDSPLDYLPTQYICDFVKSLIDADTGVAIFDGIVYKSAMHEKGANYAFFNPDDFKCTYCRTYEVTKLNYHKKAVK